MMTAVGVAISRVLGIPRSGICDLTKIVPFKMSGERKWHNNSFSKHVSGQEHT